jgi:hypothetical protein
MVHAAGESIREYCCEACSPQEYPDFYQNMKTKQLYLSSLRSCLSIVTGNQICPDTNPPVQDTETVAGK